MRAATIYSHSGGLFSLINKVAVCMERWNPVHVDFSQGNTCAYDCQGLNLWDQLFEPTKPIAPDAEQDFVVDYPADLWHATSVNAGRLYQNPDQSWRQRMHENWKKMKVHPEFEERADIWCRNNWTGDDGFYYFDVIACLVRVNKHAGEQITGRSQELESYLRAFDQNQQPSVLHVMSGDAESLSWLADRAPVTFHHGTIRTDNRDQDQFDAHRTLADARLCLEEVLILSRARALIHGVSNMATAALYINPALESIFLP